MKELSKAAKISELIRKSNPASSNSISKRRPVYGVVANDADYETRSGGAGCPAYQAWRNMLRRCYSKENLEKKPTYAGCSVDPEWHSFMAFREWWLVNHRDGWHLDKDLLILDSRKYSRESCAFVPQEINKFLIDSGAARGAWPIGVCLDRTTGRFRAMCRDGGSNTVHMGVFDRPEDAHAAWQRFKLNRLEVLRAEMDAIDRRIYNVAKAKILSYAQLGNLNNSQGKA